MSISTRILAALLLGVAALCGFDAVQDHVTDAEAQMSQSIDRVGPNWEPPAGQG